MKKKTISQDEKKTQIGSRRMGGRFYVKPFQVHDKLSDHRILNSLYDGILRSAAITEDWESDPVWVLGEFQASVKEIGGWIRTNRSYGRQLLYKLVKTGVLIKTDTGYQLPYYKKKADEGVKPADIQNLAREMRDLKKVVSGLLKQEKKPVVLDSDSQEEPAAEIISFSRETTISLFYKSVGQTRITRGKRSKAQEVYQSLRADNFTPEEIHFAVEWILENASEKPYDFALIPSVIGQALGDKENVKQEEQEEQGRIGVEQEKESAKQAEEDEMERQEKERDDWEFYKADMPEKERSELREAAITEISDSGKYTRAFINDVLITIKENEILRARRSAEEEESE